MLTPREEEGLFGALRLMVKQGLSIIFITHKLHEVMAVSTRVTILRNGKVIGTVNSSETSESDLAKLMMSDWLFNRLAKADMVAEKEEHEKKQRRY